MVNEIDYIYHIDLEYNREKLLQEALQLNFNAFPSLSAISKTKNIPTTSCLISHQHGFLDFSTKIKELILISFPKQPLYIAI